MEAKGIEGEVLKIGASEGHSVNENDAAILKALGKPESLLKTVPDRTRAAAYGRRGENPLKASLETVPILCERAPGNRSWYREHEAWWKATKSGLFQECHSMQYRGLGEKSSP